MPRKVRIYRRKCQQIDKPWDIYCPRCKHVIMSFWYWALCYEIAEAHAEVCRG